MAKWIFAGLLGFAVHSAALVDDGMSLSAAMGHGKFCFDKKEIEFRCHQSAIGPGWRPGTDGCFYRELGECLSHDELKKTKSSQVVVVEKMGFNFAPLL